MKQIPQTRDARKERDLLCFKRFGELCGCEFLDVADLAADAGDDPEIDHLREDMEERKYAEYDLLVRDVHHLLTARRFIENVAVRQRNAFWRSSRAGCIDEDGKIVGLRGRRLFVVAC